MYTPISESLGKEKFSILAGGPGSGPKPINQDAHDKLTKQGYSHVRNAWSITHGNHSVYEKYGKANKYGTPTLSKEKIVTKDGKVMSAGAATVGRPTGVNGKKMSPRRARVTKKELDKLNTKGLKAGGPGSGRHAVEKTLQKHGYKDNGSGQLFIHKSGNSVVATKHGDWAHYRSNDSMTKAGSGSRSLDKHLTNFKNFKGKTKPEESAKDAAKGIVEKMKELNVFHPESRFNNKKPRIV